MQIYILALIPIILPPLIVLCVHWYNTLFSHLPTQVQATVLDVAHVAVSAAEQSGAQSVFKKQMAEDTIHTVLKNLGIPIDPVYIDAAIESTVLALHKSMTPVEVIVPPVVAPLPPSSPVIVPSVPTT